MWLALQPYSDIILAGQQVKINKISQQNKNTISMNIVWYILNISLESLETFARILVAF